LDTLITRYVGDILDILRNSIGDALVDLIYARRFDDEAVAQEPEDDGEVGEAGQAPAPEAWEAAHSSTTGPGSLVSEPQAAPTPPRSARATAASRTDQAHRASRSAPRCQPADRTRVLVSGVSIDATSHRQYQGFQHPARGGVTTARDALNVLTG